jgi:hypothetical protein
LSTTSQKTLGLLGLREIGLNRGDVQILAAQLLAGLVQMIGVRTGNDDLGARLTERTRHLQTKPARAAGDQSTASGEIEAIQN